MTEELLRRLDAKRFTEEEWSVIRDLLKDELLYESALMVLKTMVEILREDFRRSNSYNPIEHIKTRVKSPVSLLKKVYLKGYPMDVNVIRDEINDIAGIRIVCTFKSDIHKIAEVIRKNTEIEILTIKDYVTNPKESGYQSYHMIANVPVNMINGKTYCKVEIQLRTMAMDFWASLEHKIKYKYDWTIPEEIKEELLDCSKVVDTLDDKMLNLHTKVHNPKDLQVEPNL